MKRRAVFEPSSEPNKFSFSANQTMGGSLFDGSKLGTQLDEKRAASSQQHVRALNTQFASWIQTQLKDHPDELWEDGVRDYLSHASTILEQFSDVVKWLKENTKSRVIGHEEGSHILPKAAIALKNAEIESDVVKTGIFQGNTSLSFSTPFVMPTFTSKDAKPDSDSMGLLPGNSVLTSNAPKILPNFGSKETKSNTSSGTFTGNSTESSETVMTGSKDTNFNTSGSFFANNSVPNFGDSKLTKFGTKDSSPHTGFLFGNSTPSYGISKPVPDFGSKNSDTNTSSSGLFTGNTAFNFGAPKLNPDNAGVKESTPVFGDIRAPLVNSAPITTPSWNSGAPFSFGLKSPAPVNTSTSNDQEDENEPEQPSSPSLKKVEEEGITVVHEVKCKLYVKSTDPADKDSWKDKGMGNLSIKCKEGAKRGTKECKPTIVVRNDVGRLLLNALIYPGIKTNLQKNSIVAIFHTSAEGDNDGTAVARTFLIRTKTEEDRDKLAAIIQECAPPV